MPGCFAHTFPLFHSMRWYAYHTCLRHSLAFYASSHACLHVHAWILLSSVSPILQHNEVMDTQSKPTFVPHRHHPLFAFLLVYLFAHLLSSLLLCTPCLSCLSALCLFICSLHLFFPLLVCWFLVFVFACTHMKWGHLEQGHNLPGTGKKGTVAACS